MKKFKERFIQDMADVSGMPGDQIRGLVAVPQKPEWGEFSLPCFPFARVLKTAPPKIAEDWAGKLEQTGHYATVTPVNGYINAALKRPDVITDVLQIISETGDSYGSGTEGAGKTIVMDYSHPNIAKPFGIGHLRSTIIGKSIKLLHETLGYTVIGVNHLGDWGTQFGKLITAYLKWGDEKELAQEPIKYLLKIYVRFHEEAEQDKSLDDEARGWFKKLEDGDDQAVSLWQKFRDISLEEFKKFYEILDVDFDSYDGEAFFIKMLPEVRKEVAEKVDVTESEGALIVDLSDKNMPPLMVAKSDGASTYALRDIAAVLHRIRTYNPVKIIYVVGNEQQLHFRQVFEVMERMGYPDDLFKHVNFGLINFPDGKMSTRKGNVILLEEVIGKAVAGIREIIEEKNPELANKDAVATAVGLGALIFGDLSNRRQRDIAFNWDAMLTFNGETGPYVQYTHARLCSLIGKYGKPVPASFPPELLTDDAAFGLVKKLAEFPDRIRQAAETFEPSVIAGYLIEVCNAVNYFYNQNRVLSENAAETDARILLVDRTRTVVARCLALLGMQAPEEM